MTRGELLEFLTKEAMTKVFPELKETEDEKIRKEMIEILEKEAHDFPSSVIAEKSNSWIAWLEKQGEKGINGKNREIPFSEQKPNPCGNCGIATNNCQNFPCVIRDGEQKSTDKVEPKFKVGDIIKATEDGEVFTIRTITKDKYIYTDDSFDWIKDQDEYELVEQKPTDEEMKELLHTEYEKGRADAIEEMQNHTWSEEDETALGDALWCCKQAASIAKDENDMGNVWYAENWLKSLKDRVQPQTKQEWSEEDEKYLIYNIEQDYRDKLNNNPSESLRPYYNKVISWLKSLCPQKVQKVSKEDLEKMGKQIAEYNKLLEQLRPQK